jgi:adenosylcobinamide-GDP ribazoletransferase
VCLLLLLKISLLSALPVVTVPLVLLAGHSISRLPPLLLMRRYSYARQGHSKGGAAVFKPGQ